MHAAEKTRARWNSNTRIRKWQLSNYEKSVFNGEVKHEQVKVLCQAIMPKYGMVTVGRTMDTAGGQILHKNEGSIIGEAHLLSI